MRDIGNPKFLALLEEVAAVHRAKAAGYAGSDQPDTWTNFREAEKWGLSPLEGCLVRMGDKYRRVQNLRRNAANEQVGESLRDTLMDLANYALISVCLMEEEQDQAIQGMVMGTKMATEAAALGEDEYRLPPQNTFGYRGRTYVVNDEYLLRGEGARMFLVQAVD